MNIYRFIKEHPFRVSILSVIALSMICFIGVGFFGYKIVALMMLMLLSFLAMVYDIAPVLTASILSALIWNFFFIPPLYSFHIDNAEDTFLFSLYFFIAMINAVLTNKIKRAEKQALEKEEKVKDVKLYHTVFNSLSHELKTPVSTIMTGVDTLQESNGKLNEDQKDMVLSEINTAALRLNHQIENLLNLGRLESGVLKPKPDWCDINETISGLIRKYFNEDVRNNIVFEENYSLPLFKLDAGFIERIVYNLIYNAVQYSPANSEILVTVVNTHDDCKICVSDKGPGFPEKEMENVFNRFYRLQSSIPGGSGLGLAIAKGFTEALKGRIWIKNNEDIGASVCFAIPSEMSYVNQLKHE